MKNLSTKEKYEETNTENRSILINQQSAEEQSIQHDYDRVCGHTFSKRGGLLKDNY